MNELKEVSQESKASVGLYLPIFLLERIKEAALKEDRSVNNIMVKALKEVFIGKDLADQEDSNNE